MGRVQVKRCMSHRYRHDFDDAAHVALLTLLNIPYQVMISGSLGVL